MQRIHQLNSTNEHSLQHIVQQHQIFSFISACTQLYFPAHVGRVGITLSTTIGKIDTLLTGVL